MHSVLLAGYGMLSVVATKRASDTVTRSRVFFFFAFFRQAKQSAKRARSGHTRTTGSLTRERGRLAAVHIGYASQDGYQHFSRDTHNFPNFLPSPSTTPSDPFLAAQISTMELSPGEGLRI